MNQEHVWACGQCGARVVARVGAIVRAFQAHVMQCPARARRPSRAAAPRPGHAGAPAAPPTTS
jgi:hypothetical protein